MKNFIDQQYDNLSKVDKSELKEFYETLYPESRKIGIYTDGDGRTLQGLRIGTYSLSFLLDRINITGGGESYSFGKNIVDAFKNLNKTCYKSCLFIASGSGESYIPFEHTKELSKGIKDNLVKANMCLITSFPELKIGEIVRENEGKILKLEGRSSRTGVNEDYLKEGILEDEFELEETKLSSIISSGITNNIPPDEFYRYFKGKIEELRKTKDNILKLKETPEYQKLLEYLFDPTVSCVICGESVNKNVAQMANIRINQVRPITTKRIGIEPNQALIIGANRNYVIGESSTPNINEKSVLIAISRSGASAATIYYTKDANKIGADTFGLTMDPESELGNNAKNLLILDSDDPYPDYCVLLSELLTDVGYRLAEEGIPVDERIFRAIHVRDKITK